MINFVDEFRESVEQDSGTKENQKCVTLILNGLRYNVGQLLIAEGRYQQGVNVLSAWLKAEPSPPNSARILLASAYYQIEQYKPVVSQVNTAIRNEKKRIPEDWYRLLLAAHIELKQYKSASAVAEKLIVLRPDEDLYWSQLASLYAQQNKQTSALAVQVLAQHLKQDDPKVIVRIADLYRYLAIPYKSATLLQSAIDNGTLKSTKRNLTRLADSWLAARERPKAAVILKRLAKLDDSGKTDLKYARVLFDMEQWSEASLAFRQSLKELEGKQRGLAALFAGLSEFYLGRYQQAEPLLEQASRYNQVKAQADYWLDYIARVTDNNEEQESEDVG